MKNFLLIFFLSFLFAGLVSVTAQDEGEDLTDQAIYSLDNVQQPNSIFDDPQPIENSFWEWLHPTPQGNYLRWVKMWDANNWYAAGYGGTFMKTTDAGATWSVYSTAWLDNNGSNEIIYDAHFFDMNTGLACGGNGTIARTTDAGATWDSVGAVSSAVTWYKMYFVDANLGFVSGTTSGRLAVTTDGGMTWTQNGTIASGTYYNVYAVDADTILVTTSSGNIRRTTDGGVTWATINVGFSSTLYSMEFTDPMNGWVAGSSSHAAYTTDNGLTWTDVSTGLLPSATFYDLDVVSTSMQKLSEDFTDTAFPPAGWHAKNLLGTNEWVRYETSYYSPPASARISYEATGGEDWLVTPQVSIVAGDTLKFWARRFFSSNYPPDTLQIVVSTTDTAVASFTNIVASLDVNAFSYPDFAEHVVDLSAFAGMDIYIAFRHFDDDGNGCMIDDVTIGEPMTSEQVYLTGDSFELNFTTDMGATWQTLNFLDPSQPWTSTYYSTDFLSSDHFVSVGAYGLINEVNPVLDANICHTNWIKAGTLYDLWVGSSSGTIIAVGTGGNSTSYDQAIYSTDGGNTWAVSTMMDSADLDFNSISMVDATTGYSAGEDCRVMKTTDGGVSWFRVTDPAASTDDLEEIFFVDANTGYTFGAPDEGYKTTDGGTTWSVLTTGVTTTLNGSYFIDANNGWIVGASGTCLHTTDGGATFTTQDPGYTSTLYSVWMVNSNVGYISGASGTLRKTTDGGTTWVNIDPSFFSSDPALYDIEFKNEANGMAVGSTGRVLYTNDGGTTWNFDNTGLGSTIYGVAIDQQSSEDTVAVYTCGLYSSVMRNAAVILPVELASFTASVNGNNVTLGWQTATEINNSGFNIERKAENENWTEVAFVPGHGTSTEQHQYSYVDNNLFAGVYNYRIKQIDFDGTYEYFSLKDAVEISAPDRYELSQNYPNPFNPTTKIKYSVKNDGLVTISIYNVLGEKVADIVNTIQKAGAYDITFDARNLASGMYLYKMEAGDFVSVKKMMILK